MDVFKGLLTVALIYGAAVAGFLLVHWVLYGH